jgi:hypothetical protein
MRIVRGWRWWERAIGAVCGAVAALLWLAILLPPEEEIDRARNTALKPRQRARRPVGSAGPVTRRRGPYSGRSTAVQRGRGAAPRGF